MAVSSAGGFLVVILIGIVTLPGIYSADNCTEFPVIPEDEYDRNYTSITVDGRRPLGFLKKTVPFNNPEVPFPCFTLSGVQGHSIEVMFETVPNALLCFKDQTDTRRCQEGRYRDCIPAAGADMKYQFYYDVAQGSTESDITFWVRITPGPTPEIDNEGMWCQWRDNLFPESLNTLPPGFIPPTPSPEIPTDSATVLTQSLALSLTTLLVFISASVL